MGKLLAVNLLALATVSAGAQTSSTPQPAPGPATDIQAQAQQLVELSFQIQAEIHAMKKFELSIKALRRIDEAQTVIHKMRSATPSPASSPR